MLQNANIQGEWVSNDDEKFNRLLMQEEAEKLPRKSPYKTVMEMTSEVGKNGAFMEISSLPTHFWIFL